MSNAVTTEIPSAFVTLDEHLDSGMRPFRVQSISGNRVNMQAFTPQGGTAHASLATHGVESVTVDPFISKRTGETCVTIKLRGRISVDVSAWGITLDDLAAAVAAAQEVANG